MPKLPEYLETALALINCRSAQATALCQAIASVDAYSEVPMDEKDCSESLILQFFLTKGAGADLFTVAKGVYAEREDEMINETLVMENVKSSRTFQNLQEAIYLDELLKHVDGTTALLTRTKAQLPPLNTTQRSTVQAEFRKLQSAVTAWVTEELKERVLSSIDLSLKALPKDSVTVSDQANQGKDETRAVSDQVNVGTLIDQVHTVSDQAQEAGPVPLTDILELLAAKE